MLDFIGDIHLSAPRPILRPALGQKQLQSHWHRNLAPSQRQRNQDLAARPLAQLAAVLARNPDRVLAFLNQRCVVDDQMRLRTPDHRLGFVHQGPLERRRVPARGRDEVVQLLHLARRHTFGHRLHALAPTGP